MFLFLQTPTPTVSPDAFKVQWKEIALGRSIRLLVILAIVLGVYYAARFLIRRYVCRQPQSGTRSELRHGQQVRTVADLALSALTVLVIVFSLVTALGIFGIDTNIFVAVAGFMALAIGFGGQYLVRDIINGAVIIFEDQYVVGDSVKLGDLSGQVEHVTLRRTVLRADTGALISIPNGQVDKVVNLSRDWSHVAVDVVVPRQQADTNKASAALQEVAKSMKDDAAWKGTMVGSLQSLGVEALGDTTATLRIEGRASPERHDEMVREIRRRVREKFEREKIALQSVQVAS